MLRDRDGATFVPVSQSDHGVGKSVLNFPLFSEGTSVFSTTDPEGLAHVPPVGNSGAISAGSWFPNSDQAGSQPTQEVFALGFGLRQDLGLVGIFDSNFLQEQLDGIFWLEAVRYHAAQAGGKAVSVG